MYLLVANKFFHRILVNSVKTFEARNKQYCNFIRIIFLPSVTRKQRLNVQKMR